MKRSKLFAITLQSKSGLIFFFVLAAYNLLLGIYLKDFFALSPMLLTFYLLSALPTLFFVIRIRSTSMRAIAYVVLFFAMGFSIVYSLYCRRLLLMMTFFTTAAELMYLAIFDNSSGKDKLLTKIYVLAVSGLIIVTLISAFNFVCKPHVPYLLNGGATLWDAQTEELAEEICAVCETDEEKVQAFYHWMIQNFEYDYEADPLIQYFDVRRTLRTRKGLCYDFSHLFAAFCRSQNIPCYVIDGMSRTDGSDFHTWNRVYYNGSWWNMDVTHDITYAANGKKLYGFHELESISAFDEDFFITKIY